MRRKHRKQVTQEAQAAHPFGFLNRAIVWRRAKKMRSGNAASKWRNA